MVHSAFLFDGLEWWLRCSFSFIIIDVEFPCGERWVIIHIKIIVLVPHYILWYRRVVFKWTVCGLKHDRSLASNFAISSLQTAISIYEIQLEAFQIKYFLIRSLKAMYAILSIAFREENGNIYGLYCIPPQLTVFCMFYLHA